MNSEPKFQNQDWPGKQTSRLAMTLIEVLIAMTVLSVILAITYSVLISTILAKKFVENETQLDRVGASLLSLIARDVQACYLYQLEQNGFWGRTDETGQPRLDFITQTDISSSGLTSDINEVGYFLRNNPGEAGTYKLMRREDFFLDDEPLAGGYALRLYDRVTELKLRYFTPEGEVKNSWKTGEGVGLPWAVEISLGLKASPRPVGGQKTAPPAVRDRVFRTFVKIAVSPTIPKESKEPDGNK